MKKNGKATDRRMTEDKLLSFIKKATGRKVRVSDMKTKFDIGEERLYELLGSLRKKDLVIKSGPYWIALPETEGYVDWNGNLKKMKSLYEMRVPTLLIGPKGTGKTECTHAVAKILNKELYTINLSLRCRESHILGRLDIKEKNGQQEVTWLKGPLPLSMEAGGLLYLDELSAGEPDVLLRLDECLDSRRQLSHEGQTINARDEWWVTASINT